MTLKELEKIEKRLAKLVAETSGTGKKKRDKPRPVRRKRGRAHTEIEGGGQRAAGERRAGNGQRAAGERRTAGGGRATLAPTGYGIRKRDMGYGIWERGRSGCIFPVTL
jgi:hypothetical protein